MLAERKWRLGKAKRYYYDTAATAGLTDCIRYASCNAQEFLVHDITTAPAAVGEALAEQKQIWFFGRRNDTDNYRLLRTTAPGQQWGWNFLHTLYDPQVRIVRQSDDIPLYVWESETPVSYVRQDVSPIIETDDYGRSYIPSGGSAVWMNQPTEEQLDTLKDIVEAASTPSWLSDTNWTHITTNAQLLKLLFWNEQRRGNLEPYNDHTQVFNRQHSSRDFDWKILIWLRCASRILYDHFGQSCIPLILNRFSIDEYGSVTLR